MIAGMSFDNTVLHLGHAIAHTMGAVYHIPTALPAVLPCPKQLSIFPMFFGKIKIIGRAMGLDMEGKSA